MTAGSEDANENADRRDKLIEVKSLNKTFSVGLFKKRRVEAVKGVSFDVRRGEIFGFLGPNGAGKTTTIKMLTGLIEPTSGDAFLFGKRVPSAESRRDVGFLPENPYVYPYLTPREFVEMCGNLSGMRGASLRSRTLEVLTKVGIAYAADRQVRRLSKGMLQRTGLAAALVSDPQMLILDEPMSGLDPVGRKEVRDLIFAERELGRTIFFSTHILSDVEAMCDRVTILRQGEAVVSGEIRQLLRGEVLRTDVFPRGRDARSDRCARGRGASRSTSAQAWVVVEVESALRVEEVLKLALAHGSHIVEVAPRKETLEDLFMRRLVAHATDRVGRCSLRSGEPRAGRRRPARSRSRTAAQARELHHEAAGDDPEPGDHDEQTRLHGVVGGAGLVAAEVHHPREQDRGRRAPEGVLEPARAGVHRERQRAGAVRVREVEGEVHRDRRGLEPRAGRDGALAIHGAVQRRARERAHDRAQSCRSGLASTRSPRSRGPA
jgi:ABC-2 type transport system ATP-binding protein